LALSTSRSLQINFGGYPSDESVTTPGYTLGGGAEWALPTSQLAFGAVTKHIRDDRTFSSLISKILGDWLRKQNKQDSWR
jgi:hypothetical protein